MKMNGSFLFRRLAGTAPLFIHAALSAAPLTWFPGPSLDTPVSGAATTVAGSLGNLVIGGTSDYYFESYPESLVATNIYWTPLPPMYNVRIAPGAVANGGMVVVFGGTDGTNSTSTAVGYSPSGDTPLNLASMSVARSYLGYAPDANGLAYAIGGLDDTGQPLSSAERYDPDLDSWAAVAPLPAARYDFPAVFDRAGHIYVFGGRTDTTAGTEVGTVLRYSISANTWTAMAPMPTAVAGSAAALGADGKIYVAGGVSGGVTTNVVQVYNPAGNSWAISTPLPEALNGSALGVDRLGRLIVMGGADTNGNDVGDVWRSQQLGAPDTTPVFTLYPGTNVVYPNTYTSSINATGNPQPTYLVFSGPGGMNVDPFSGAITWTPQAGQIGSNSVTIRATNYAGYADWSFSVTVAPPPPSIPTNLTLVGVSDNSVTLAWDAESPLVGPVSYSVYLWHVVYQPKGGSRGYWVLISSGLTSPTATIGGLPTGSSHIFSVTASAGGITTANSSGISATTTAPQGPPALSVTAVTSTTVSLAWDPSPGPAQNPLYSPIASYTIMERNVSVSPPVNIPTVANITGTNGIITGLTPGHSHIWYVSGIDVYSNASPLGVVYVIVTNPVPASPLIGGGAPLANGSFQFTVQESGPMVQTVVIQANTDLHDPAGWVQIGSILPDSSVFTFTDTNAAQYPARFYRVSAP